jgi:predicted nucleic acid-binding protein
MTEPIFLDSAALVAILNRKDQYHAQAVAKLNDVQGSRSVLLTTTHVFAETVTRILRRVSHQKATEAGRLILKEPQIEIVTPSRQAIEEAWAIFEKYEDQAFSLVDCISFAVMRHFNIRRAFTFDVHFTIMGYELI